MTRSLAAVALTLFGVACAPPQPEEPAPYRVQIDALLPTPELDAVRADCIAARIAEAANAGGERTPAHRARVRPDPLAGAPEALANTLFSWAPNPSDRIEAARTAVGRIRGDWYVAADYSELAEMHARAFRLAAEGIRPSDRARRDAEGVLRVMTGSQPDLEALYQQAFEARYRGEESCSR